MVFSVFCWCFWMCLWCFQFFFFWLIFFILIYCLVFSGFGYMPAWCKLIATYFFTSKKTVWEGLPTSLPSGFGRFLASKQETSRSRERVALCDTVKTPPYSPHADELNKGYFYVARCGIFVFEWVFLPALVLKSLHTNHIHLLKFEESR